MFDSLGDEKLRAAHDAAQLLYDNHRALGLDTLCADIAVDSRTGASRSRRQTAARQPGPGNELPPPAEITG